MAEAHPYLPDALNKKYKYIHVTKHTTISPSISVPHKPSEFYYDYKIVQTFFDSDYINITDITSLISKFGDNNEDYVINANDDLSLLEIRLCKKIKRKNLDYDNKLKAYEQELIIYEYEKSIYPQIVNLWQEWATKEENTCKLNRYKQIREQLEKESL